MLEFVEWQLLTQEWAKSLSKARVKEAVIADRMNSFLKGNGCLPTIKDLEEVDILWNTHLEKRQALNKYVSKVINEYQGRA